MSNLYSIPGITDAEVGQLRTHGFESSGDLWTKLKEDQLGALAELARDTGLPSERLVALLGSDVRRDGRRLKGAFPRRHWADLTAFGAVALFIWATASWGGGDLRRGVLARIDMPAFHEIAADELDAGAVPIEQRAAELARYSGRYTKEKIEAGAKLTPKLVGVSPANFKGLALLRLSLRLPPADAERTVPYGATLIISRAKDRPPASAVDVTVLAYLNEKEPAVVVALKPDQLAQVGPPIGPSNVYLAQPAR